MNVSVGGGGGGNEPEPPSTNGCLAVEHRDVNNSRPIIN